MQLPPAPPEPPSPRKKLPSLRLAIPVLAIVLVVAVLVGALQIVRGAANPKRAASGPVATATTTTATSMATTTMTASGTATPGPTPLPTATSSTTTQTANVRVTQNQDERQACIDDPKPYTVVLYNAGNVAANWQVNIPVSYGDIQDGRQPLAMPFMGPAQWASATPQHGSIAPGQSADFLITVVWPMPCGSTLYKAAVQLTFPAGVSQADIPLTFGGAGPARYSNVVLASGSPQTTQPCPASGVAPDPYTFVLKNTGNYYADIGIVAFDAVGSNQWATLQVAVNPQEPRPSSIYPGQTWTTTVSPQPGVLCNGTIYHIHVYITNSDGTQVTMTLTDTFN